VGVQPPKPEDLADIEAIRQLKAAYFRAIDTKDWDLLGSLFTEDGVLDAGGGPRQGPAEIVRVLSKALDDVSTVHHGHTSEITVTGDGTATGVWAMDDRLEWGWESASAGAAVGFHGAGHYRDTYRRGDDGWRFEHVVLSRLRVDPLPGGMPRR